MNRRHCEEPGCKNLGRNKGRYKDTTRYGRFCELHHRMRSDGVGYPGRWTLPNLVCERCGWDKAPCDRHRKVKALGYTEENVIILCPNCHRVAHLK